MNSDISESIKEDKFFFFFISKKDKLLSENKREKKKGSKGPGAWCLVAGVASGRVGLSAVGVTH